MISENHTFETPAVASANGNAAPRPLSAENIPTELKSISRWLLWRLETRNGKATKTPYQVSGAFAKVNDPATWTTFDDALAAYLAGGFSGLGVALSSDDDLLGIDLDKCLNPDTGELDDEAAAIVAMLPTYCEISPSGRGLRLFGFGKLPQGGRRKGKVEMYEAGRYLTVTGHRFNGHDALAEITPQLAEVHARIFGKPAVSKPVDAKTRPADPPDLNDAALLDKARRARNGATFDALWSGDTSGHGGDHSAADQALCNELAFYTGNDPSRVDRLFRQSGLMRDKWDKVHYSDGRTYGQATVEKAISGNRETYSARRPDPTDAKARSVAGDAGAQCRGENPYRGTDAANAEIFIELYGRDVRYIPPWSKWLVWTGSHWRIDDAFQVRQWAAKVPRALYQKAGGDEDAETRKKIVGVARLLEDHKHQSNMLASVMPHVVAHHSDLNRGHFLLNVRNGTLDLTTGRLRPHERADLLTHDTDIFYDPTATCPTWLRFLSAVFSGDDELISFVQRAVGYSLTGATKEQVLFVGHGTGSNGKGKFLNVLRKLLGSLAAPAPAAMLMTSKTERHPTELATLFGKRAVVAQETNEGQRFNESLVKQLTGEDAISARRMREDFWEFEPTHKLWLATNHKPTIKGTDHAIWRRMRLIPFNVKFHDPGAGEPVKDLDLEAKLMVELSGILAWAVRGCLDWQRIGLGTSEAVTKATDAYQAEMDVLAAWLADCCVVNKLAEAKAADLYASYIEWCESQGERPEPQRSFGLRLTERGFSRQRRMVGHFWIGIGLLDTRHDPYDPNDPIIQINSKNESHEALYGKAGSYGSYGSCSPPVETLPPDEGPPPGSVWDSALGCFRTPDGREWRVGSAA